MKYFKDILCLFSSVLVLGLPNACSRKYDIEAEAQKLYGEDLQSVLKRFRKTPEYLSILEVKLNEVKMNIDEMAGDIQTYYEEKMLEKVEEILGVNRTYVEDVKRKFMRDRYPLFRRQADTSVTPAHNKTGVERVDSYMMLHKALSVEERNKFRDLGFEFAGHVIHGLISATAGDESLQQSTLSPYGSDDQNAHTTHQHHVTHESTAMGEENPTTEGHAHSHALHTQPPDNYNYQTNNIHP